MLMTEVNRKGLEPSFESGDPSLAPGNSRLSYRMFYYHLVNIEEHPEILPLAYDVVKTYLSDGVPDPEKVVPAPSQSSEARGRLDEVRTQLSSRCGMFSRPWRQATEELTRRQVLHYLIQYMPTAFVDGCWLQCGLRVATAHTRVGASLTGLYQHQVRAFVADPGRHFVADYRDVYERLGAPLEEISSRSFAERGDFLESSFALPIFLLAIAQFPRCYPAEILGLNLAWQFLGLSAFGPDLIRDATAAYGLPRLGEDLAPPDYLETGRNMAYEAGAVFLEQTDSSTLAEAWQGLQRGVTTGVRTLTDWLERTKDAAPLGPPDPRQEMIDLVWRKAPHGRGYHAQRTLGTRRIDDHLDQKTFDGPALLEDFANSPWVKAGAAEKSPFLKRLVGFGGPMFAVFSPVELQIIANWIDSLPPKGSEANAEAQRQVSALAKPPTGPSVRESEYVEGRAWTPATFGQRSERLCGRFSIRELYHYLINVEFHPEILPVAEQFARDRLERSMAMLWRGERPIPSRKYDPAALERWVHEKHREQVDSYRPPDVRPDAPKDQFIEVTVQLAPLILIDGGWLQGIASPALIHTPVGRMLFHVLVEELGEGKCEEHHANVYRDLLKSMGVEPPPVDAIEFAQWSRLDDSSFDVPTLWLSISCFPRHFLPEILGLNLAVELAGVGGPYMEARDTLRQFGYPTLFVNLHNAADNVSVGHSAWAVNAIKRYMDEVAEREGPHNLDYAWHRVWTGVRATLPQIGRLRMMAHSTIRRFVGANPTRVPTIFPA